jgi:PAS domain S-box-containing protein
MTTTTEHSAPPAQAPVTRRAPRARVVALVLLVYLVGYVLLDLLSAVLQPDPTTSLWFAPTTLGLVLLFTYGVRYSAVVVLGPIVAALVAVVIKTLPTGGEAAYLVLSDVAKENARLLAAFHSPGTVIGLALVNAAVLALGAFILRRGLQVDAGLVRVRDAFYFLLVALMAALLIAVFGEAFLAIVKVQAWKDGLSMISKLWNSQMWAFLTLGPFLLTIVDPWLRGLANPAALSTASARNIWLATAETLGWLAGLGVVLFITLNHDVVQEMHLFYLFFLYIVWITLRHGVRGASMGMLGVSLGVLAAIPSVGINEFSPTELQIFALTLTLTGLLLGAVVSEQKLSEERTREREEQLRTLINAMPDVVIFKDGAGRWLEANAFGLQLYGIGEGFHGKRNAEQVVESDEMRRALSVDAVTDENAWDAREQTRAEETLARHDGAPLTFDVVKVPLYQADGSRKALLVLARDITERKEAQEAIETERAYLTSAIDILPIPLAFRATDGTWSMANSASQDFFQYLPPERWFECGLLTPESRTRLTKDAWPVLRALRGEVTTSQEMIMQRPDGSEAPVLAHAAPIYVGGRLVAAVAAFQDISALKEADRAKDQFLGILSHELLTPLSNMLSWTQAANESEEMVPQALEIIERNIRRQHGILTDLLDLSRVMNGRLGLDRSPLDLSQLLETQVDTHAQEASVRRRSLELTPVEEPLYINADRARLIGIIDDLFAFALKNTGPGDTITASLSRQGDMAVLVIRDTGKGIAPEGLSHVFNPFQTGEHGDAVGGFGLKLALAKGLVELHGGRISVFSPGLGYGTVFNLEFPLVDEEDAAPVVVIDNWDDEENTLPEA